MTIAPSDVAIAFTDGKSANVEISVKGGEEVATCEITPDESGKGMPEASTSIVPLLIFIKNH